MHSVDYNLYYFSVDTNLELGMSYTKLANIMILSTARSFLTG